MGQLGVIEILHNRYDPAAREVLSFDGTLLDAIDRRFPKGLGEYGPAPQIVNANTGDFVHTECSCRYCQPKSRVARIFKSKRPAHCKVNAWLKTGGHYIIDMGRSPKGVDPFTAALIVFASVAISVAAAILLQPKIPGAIDQAQAGKVYSVGAQANEAKLGGVVPVQYGTFTRAPEYASQSYRVYADNEEIRYFLLSLGAGNYSVNEIYIGDTPVSSLPSGIVDYEVYTQADHLDTLGTIGSDFGMHEDVTTSGEVDQLELEAVRKLTDTYNASATSGNSRLLINDSEITDSAIDVGDTLIIENTAIAGTYTVSAVNTSGSIYIDIEETFPANLTDTDVDIVIKGGASIERGYFVVNRAGTTTQSIEIDVDFPAGIFKQKDNGAFQNLTITLQATVQEIDDNGDDVGSPTTHNFSVTSATNTHQRRTFEIDKTGSAGRYKVKLKRTDDQELQARDANRSLWTGLKAYLDYPEQDVYGYTTIVAMSITGAQELSGTSQQRIRVNSTRIINQLGTSTPDSTGNLADVMADIITDANYGAGGSASEYSASAFGAFRTAQASRAGFNGVFDTPMTVWEALVAVAALGRAKPYPKGLAISLVVDEVKSTRSTIITPDNILPRSFKAQYTWIEPGGHDGIEIEYRDSLENEPKYTRYPTDSLDPERIRFIGMDDDDEADSMAEYMWSNKTVRNLSLEWQMELAGLNLEPYQRVGIAMPVFSWADAAHVTASSGTSVTLSKEAPSGSLSVIFRDQNGDATGVLSATGDGTKTITLGASPPITLVSNGKSVPTLCAFALASSFDIVDATILSIKQSGNRTSISAVNYDADIFTGLV